MKTKMFTRVWTWLLPVLLWLGASVSAVAQLAISYNTTGTWVAPAGVTSVTVECWGGGGRGAGRTSSGNGGGGGGGGAYARSTLTVTPGNSYTVTIGAGSTSAAAGGDSWFSSAATILAKGGNSVADNVSTGATGGTVAASIGTTRFAGGNGASTTVTNGGGGGSSAGTAAAGTIGAVSSGGVAPAGGGNGGDGRTGSNGDGFPGVAPGGGGGGARRSGISITNRDGGAGAAGRVVITYNYTEGSCLTASSTIRDNGCAANNRLTVTLPKSGLPTTLGSSPGNARITGLELIVAHAFNADLEITLTSPTGQTRNMILDRFNAGVNLGNPSTCAVLSLVDGAAALTTTTTSNVTGNYAPEQTLAGFTGDPNGNWTINICDDAANDVGSFRLGRLNFCTVPSTATVGGPQNICPAGTSASLGGNTPAFGTGAWSVVSGGTGTFSDATSPSSTFTHTGGAGPVVVRWTISSGSCTPSTADVTLTINSGCTYYSRNSGNITDNIWSLTPLGTPGPAGWTAANNMIVQSGHTITVNSAQNVGNITVDNGGTLVLGAFNLTANGTSVDVNGTLTANDNSTLTIAGSGAKTLDLSSTTSFWNLTCNASSGTTVTGNATIRNTLLLSAGNFNCTGNPVALESNATRTGRLGPVGATASYTGDLTVNRYIPAGATNWRMMGSPVAGQTVNQWKDDYITAGFPGSHYPTFASPVGSGILWPSIRHYDETNTGAGVNDGLIGVSGIAQSLAAGKGFASWCGSGFATTTAFTVDMSGNPHVANTPITLPMTYTNTGVPATDGWNMVSNPLASPIAFDQISRGANVEDYITYFDPATGNNATYDISLGAGTNGGTNIIQSSQGFWLKANGAAVTTTVEEADKVENNGGGFFGGDQVQTANLVRLQINSAINQYSDETLVVFSDGQPETTNEDVPKFIFAHPDAPQIATQGDAGEMIAINAYGPYAVDISIPVMVNVAINGNYTITATGLDDVGLSCLRLEDLATNTITPLVEGTAYTFAALANDDPNEARFVLHASAPMQLVPTNATCNGRDDGSASVSVGSGPVDILWMDAEGAVLLEQNNVMPGTSEIMALEAGEYRISINGNASCSTLETVFTIEEPTALEATAITEPSSCPQSEDGTIDLTVLGGEAPYTFNWSNEAADEDLTVPAGTYTVTITDANGCELAPQEYVVGAGEGPDAGISLETFIVMVGEEVVFAPNTLAGVSNTWDFGDGTTSTDLEGVHTYTVPGTYTVTLTVDDGSCTSTASIQLEVETTTGLPTVVGKDLNAWVSGDHIVVDHNFGTNAPVFIRIFSTGGQLVQEHRVANAPARITLPASELATGIWMVRVSNGNHMRTFSLPVVH